MGQLKENLVRDAFQYLIDCVPTNLSILFPQVQLWRLERFTETCIKASEMLRQRGITNRENARQLTDKFRLLYIAQASVEDDPTLQNFMAGLLANAMDPNFDKEKLRIAYLDILKALDPCDAQILEHCYKKPLPCIMQMNEIVNALNITEDTYNCSLENLKRLSLVRVPLRYSDAAIVGASYVSNDNSEFQLTTYCQSFLQACAL